MLPHLPATLARYILTSHGVKSIVTNIRECSDWNRHSNSGRFCPHCDCPACERDYIGHTEYIHQGKLWKTHMHVCDCCNKYFHVPVSAKEYTHNAK